ncbi:4-hydroxybutyryl-CoA dehydratase [Porphyromonas macacae]|uniref:4-hydroxybutyryl-CoA dehydratase n=1 Tax=Porphyromonas macacae TaxID=28115 RepID=A0A0A2GFV0_9PORP|nr:4-hydroxyphenylacetate 3-hydroxylase family protein [Porphyromonas macacae]KGN73406.1 4-hydroxybutyryl-CoA dehydratase [Porphyromonas macacae]KGN99329.1 4-hydroxybutyryl-CoA dehydratase [Porphyromonas macacae]SUB77469.1 4-hydroxybutyryl-CoA dehydratase/vinylacetyl-CoA-Delta-isomerase [Porphyromonas macacae]SUB88086.1 4-hydroxybutyryl-CoA dehydratase/vinylacetyl-CoA-Delta-isomerase [Porphyromonas macacae]
MMTKEEYIESLRKLDLKVYLMGKRIENPVDHPMIRPSLNSVAMSYELAQKDEYKDLMTATSNLTGKTVNRFCHLHQSPEDLVKKVKMQRLMGQKTAACFQRCVGMDAFNAIFSTTYEMDQALGTEYHKRFRDYMVFVQENDLVVDGAMTDPKGDRGLSPSQQPDPDMYMHVVEVREDGIVVRGAKAHQTGAVNSHEHLIMPTVAMKEADADYAISFAVPSDAPGVMMIYGRQSCDTRKMEEGADIDLGNNTFGGHEALVVFDNVFVPKERVFMCREYQFAGMMVERFAGYHRQSYGGCKVGVGDVLIGAAALAADYNGVPKASHIKDKIIEMMHLNETLYACGIACSAEGTKTASGNYIIDLLLANVCKQNVTRLPYEIARLAEDIAGGLMVTMPSEQDYRDPYLGPIVRKYLQGARGKDTENRMRVLRLIENITLGTAAVGYRTESMHGAGSPQAQRIMISRQGDLEGKKALAAAIAHIDPSKDKNA